MFVLLFIALAFGAPIDETTYSVPALTLSDCTDDRFLGDVFVDVETWTLYGDQDSNGRIDGDDCNWR